MSLSKHTLTLLRHAKSSWDNPGLADHDRPLNDRGERDAPEMGRRLKMRGVRPSLLIASTAMRTTQTARLVAAAIGFPAEFIHRERDLYHASARQIMQVVCRQDPTFQHVLVIGHNPGISELADQLSDGLTGSMPTAAMLTVEAEVDDWSGFEFAARRVVGYDYPKNHGDVLS